MKAWAVLAYIRFTLRVVVVASAIVNIWLATHLPAPPVPVRLENIPQLMVPVDAGATRMVRL